MTPSKISSVAQTQGPSSLGQSPRTAMAQKRGDQHRPWEEVVRKASWRRRNLSYILTGGLKYHIGCFKLPNHRNSTQPRFFLFSFF